VLVVPTATRTCRKTPIPQWTAYRKPKRTATITYQEKHIAIKFLYNLKILWSGETWHSSAASSQTSSYSICPLTYWILTSRLFTDSTFQLPSCKEDWWTIHTPNRRYRPSEYKNSRFTTTLMEAEKIGEGCAATVVRRPEMGGSELG